MRPCLFSCIEGLKVLLLMQASPLKIFEVLGVNDLADYIHNYMSHDVAWNHGCDL